MNALRHEFFNPATFSGAIAYGVLFFAFAWLLSRIVGGWIHRLASHPSLFVSRTSATFVAQLFRVVCFLLSAAAYSHLIPALDRFGNTLLASAGVISLIVGLAAQNTLGQLVAGVALLIYRPFEMDQALTVVTSSGAEKAGVVREFTLGYTRLGTEDGRSIIVPNNIMLSSVLIRSERARVETPVARKTASGKAD